MKKSCILFLILLCFSCQQKFNKRLWEYRDDMGMFPNRELMLDDVLKHVKIKGRSYKQIVTSLGETTGITDGKLYYNIALDYGWDIDPLYSKDLIIYFNRDSVATGYKVQEWKH